MTRDEFRNAIDQTAEDAARFRFLASHPEHATTFEHAVWDSLETAESTLDIMALIRGAVDALRVPATAGYTNPQRAPT